MTYSEKIDREVVESFVIEAWYNLRRASTILWYKNYHTFYQTIVWIRPLNQKMIHRIVNKFNEWDNVHWHIRKPLHPISEAHFIKKHKKSM